jgi:hypothetical protein
MKKYKLIFLEFRSVYILFYISRTQGSNLALLYVCDISKKFEHCR